MSILPTTFFQQDVLLLAPALLGKILVRRFDDGTIERFRITETEAYRGEEDKGCHASKGCTQRTRIMYHSGGKIYVYLIYGIYWMLNIVSGKADEPQAVLIRGVERISGPGRIGKRLLLDKSFYGEVLPSSRIWIEDDNVTPEYITTPRIGIDYAEEWKDIEWRFVVSNRKA